MKRSHPSVTDPVKRITDICLATAGLMALSPVLAIVALTVAAGLGRPVLFRQKRPGLNGRIFRMIKFRTMTDRRDENGALLPDEKRLTPLGRFLRSTSLDELPELLNVLMGDMSLVGPRPLLVEYLPLYNTEQARRHLVRPGVTGWAQVNGRNAISWDEKFSLDVWYVDNWSRKLDWRILAMTVRSVFRREGINAEDHSTMPPFGASR